MNRNEANSLAFSVMVLRACKHTPIIVPDLSVPPIRTTHGTPIMGVCPDRMAMNTFAKLFPRGAA